MFKLYLFMLVVLHGANSQEDCVPDPVFGIQLEPDYLLHWQESTNCEVTRYIIYVSPVDATGTNVFEATERRVHLPHLPMCEMFRFTVVAVSHDTVSSARFIETKVPALPGTNISVTHMNAYQQSENTIYLEWELDPEYAHCVERFRVVRWDFETIPVSQYSSDTSALVAGVAPCTHFELTVTPIYGDAQEGGIGAIRYDTPGHSLHLPTLVSVSQGPTFVVMDWAMISYQVNRCTISSIIVDGSPYVNLTFPFTDSHFRPRVDLRVESLQPDKMYQFRVSVVNSAGVSKPYPVAIQTLPLTGPSN